MLQQKAGFCCRGEVSKESCAHVHALTTSSNDADSTQTGYLLTCYSFLAVSEQFVLWHCQHFVLAV